MGGARHPGRDAGYLRRRAIDCGRHHRYGDLAAHRELAEGRERYRGGCPMTFDPGMPMVPEVALFVLAVIVLLAGLMRRPRVNVERDLPPSPKASADHRSLG